MRKANETRKNQLPAEYTAPELNKWADKDTLRCVSLPAHLLNPAAVYSARSWFTFSLPRFVAD